MCFIALIQTTEKKQQPKTLNKSAKHPVTFSAKTIQKTFLQYLFCKYSYF